MVLGAAIGLAISMCLFVPLYVLTFAGGTSIAAYVFPFALIANPHFYDPLWITLLFALIQVPIYGAAYGFVRARKPSVLWVVVGGLFITHIIGLAGATSRLKTYNEQRWEQIQSRWRQDR